MNNQDNKLFWFFVSFAPSFGGYLALHFLSQDYYGAVDFFAALVSIPVLVIAWAMSRKENRSLAQGFIWSLAAIFIFLFTYGGCGMLRIY